MSEPVYVLRSYKQLMGFVALVVVVVLLCVTTYRDPASRVTWEPLCFAGGWILLGVVVFLSPAFVISPQALYLRGVVRVRIVNWAYVVSAHSYAGLVISIRTEREGEEKLVRVLGFPSGGGLAQGFSQLRPEKGAPQQIPWVNQGTRHAWCLPSQAARLLERMRENVNVYCSQARAISSRVRILNLTLVCVGVVLLVVSVVGLVL